MASALQLFLRPERVDLPEQRSGSPAGTEAAGSGSAGVAFARSDVAALRPLSRGPAAREGGGP